MMKERINPLSRRPKQKRLVIAVRGAAGTGKSHFAASLADAGVGRLCLFDVERKARLLPGVNLAKPKFDAIEIHQPDELPEFIDWALDGEGREQNYGCYALDSWTMYFGRMYRKTLEAIRERTGDPLAQPTAEQLQADQMVYQEVLRRLCIDSGACVVITDQIAAKGKEEREENELGRVLPMTMGGLEYFVDVMIELSLRMTGLDTVRVARVIKTNSPYFPIGLEIVNPVFADFLSRMDDVSDKVIQDEVPDFLRPQPQIAAKDPTLNDLRQRAMAVGIDEAKLLMAARYYHQVESLEHLSQSQIENLLLRIAEKYAGSVEEAKGKRKLDKAA
jgi:RNase P/RNase MRP subunit POP5